MTISREPTGPFLCSEMLTAHQPLGSFGNPAYVSARQIIAGIRSRFSGDLAAMLAIPQANEAGDRLDWYAPNTGQVVPWTALSEEERVAARGELHRLRDVLTSIPESEIAAASGDRAAFLRQLPLATQWPDEKNIFLVAGRPVVTFWAFAEEGVSLRPLSWIGPEPVGTVPATPVVPSARRRLWGLAALPLLGLPLIFLLPEGGEGCIQLDGTSDLVLALDTSGSMAISAAVPNSELRALMDRASRWDLVARIKLDSLFGNSGNSRRIDMAKGAISGIVDHLPDDQDVGFITFGSCGGIGSHGTFRAQDRARLQNLLGTVEPEGGTPLAAGMEAASGVVDGIDRPATIVIISDGAESCKGDPCAVARRLKQAKPKLVVNIVDITGDLDGACIAQETGGKVYTASEAATIKDTVKAAASSCR